MSLDFHSTISEHLIKEKNSNLNITHLLTNPLLERGFRALCFVSLAMV